jgi:acyl-CoA thioester hydrolase
MTDICCYQGLVRSHQASLSGELRVDAAASIVADALEALLAMRRGTARGQAASAGPGAAVAEIHLEQAGAAAPRWGELVSCWIAPPPDAPSKAASNTVTARVVGPEGIAWRATLRLQEGLPAVAHASPAVPPEHALPPLRILRPMRKLDCDQAGHVNVQVFMDLADEAVGVLCLQARPAADRLQIVQARVSFKQELFEGDVVAVHSGIRSVAAQGLEVVHGIVHQPSGLVACVLETRIAALDAEGQSAAASGLMPPADSIGDWPSLPPARPPSQPRVPGRPPEQAVTTVLSVVDAWDADASGCLTTRALVNLCSTGARQYLARIGLTGERFLREQITVAAVDYLVEIRQRPRLGCNLELRSAYLSGSAKSIRFSHHVMDADDGTVYATVEIVGVMLDLATHRSMEVPADVRQRLAPVTA